MSFSGEKMNENNSQTNKPIHNLENEKHSILYYMNEIAMNFPYIFSAIVFLYLIYQSYFVYLLFFIVGFFANKQISKILKLYFKTPRPSEKNNKMDSKNPEKYGFPSGHAQILFFAISFLLFVVFYSNRKNFNLILIFSFFFAIATFLQRWMTQMHTFEQLLGGAFFGSLVGIITASIGNLLIRNI